MVGPEAVAPPLRATLVAAVGAIAAPPIKQNPEEAAGAAPIRAALVAAVGAIAAPPIQQNPEEAAGAAPIRAALATVGATRAEEALPTLAPRAAPTTRLTTQPAIS